MKQNGFRLADTRFGLLQVVFFVCLTLWFVVRVALAGWSWGEWDSGFLRLLRVFGVGFLYDLASCSFLCIPFLLPLLFIPRRFWNSGWNRAVVHVLFIALFFGLLFVTVAEFLFWEEFSARFNFIAVDYLIYTQEVTGNILESYPVAAILAGVGAAAVGLWYMLRRRIGRAFSCDLSLRARAVGVLTFAVLPSVAYLGLGQGLRQTGRSPYLTELASNGPYQFVAAFRNNELDYETNYATLPPEEAAEELRSEVAEPRNVFADPSEPFDLLRSVPAAGSPKRLNVFLIMVESLNDDYLAHFGNTEKITPNLDRLADESLLFTNFYATGTRTVRGLEAVTLSVPPTPGSAIVKRAGRESGLWSLGNVLRAQGYETDFLYGGYGYFDNMNEFFSGNGYRVFDLWDAPKEEVGFKNAWGMADEYLYAQALKRADQAHAEGKPFFFHLMTTSNHRPYTYPSGRIDLPSGSGRHGAVKYTDWAIGDLLAKAREKTWFEDTLFVIIADHQATSAGKVDIPADRYRIPLLLYCPKYLPPGKVDTLSCQIDVAPTLLSWLGLPYDSEAFGKDILAMSASEGRALFGNYEYLGLLEGDEMAILTPQSRIVLRRGATTATPKDTSGTRDYELVKDAIAFYQGAAYIYGHGLNCWPSRAAGVAAVPPKPVLPRGTN